MVTKAEFAEKHAALSRVEITGILSKAEMKPKSPY